MNKQKNTWLAYYFHIFFRFSARDLCGSLFPRELKHKLYRIPNVIYSEERRGKKTGKKTSKKSVHIKNKEVAIDRLFFYSCK